MGGSLFSSGPDPLFTPRMDGHVYREMRDACHALLRELFLCVASPIEGPGKTDYGDIDILVSLEKRVVLPSTGASSHPAYAGTQSTVDAIQRLLGSVRAVSGSMAIPWPESLLPAEDDGPERYIQVDVRICTSVAKMQWMLFKHGHGDLWNILGSVIRPLGITIDDDALWLRIPEIETMHRARAKVYLTAEPAEILHFLGLPIFAGGKDLWSHPFATAEEMFEYVASNRLFWINPEAGTACGYEHDNVAVEDLGAKGRQELKANDRKRIKKRPVFSRWWDEFVPAARAAGRFPRKQGITRDLVRAGALARWPAAQLEWDRRLNQFIRDRLDEKVWNVAIKTSVPDVLDPSGRGVVCAALRKVIMQNDETFGIVAPTELRDANGHWDLALVTEFVRQHWQKIGAVAMQRGAERYREYLERKPKR
jgi:hypothetical protein